MNRTYRSFAKINLHLELLGRRPDGYHELRTVFQSVALWDSLTVAATGRGVALEVVGGEVTAGPDNLAYRAAQRFLERWAPHRGVRLSLRKRIPVGGGLGGGSSNAATVLRALRELFGEPASVADLGALAADLGADVPYFLIGGTALGEGRGDRITPLPDLPERDVWLVTPPLEIRTAEVFEACGRLTPRASVSSIGALVRGEVGEGWTAVAEGWNDLERVVLHRFPAVKQLHQALLDAGASWVRLSGSGATLFAPCEEDVADLSEGLPPGNLVSRVRTLTRASLRRLQLGS